MRRQRQNCFTESDFLENNEVDIDYIIECLKNKACFITDYYGNILYVNKEWENIYKYDKYYAIGKTCKILHGEKTDETIFNNYLNKLYLDNKSIMININYNGKKQLMNVEINSNKILYAYDRNNSYFFSTIKII